VEQSLLEHGWGPLGSSDYDDHYYRTWMHELPPLRHRDRGTVVDVHHTILPLTGRLLPDPALLLAEARPIPDGRFLVLSPVDMVLHTAAHLFQDGDLSGGMRDLNDLDIMMRHFAVDEPGFWERLAPRAGQLHLQRPLYYAIRYATRLLRTPVPDDVFREVKRWAPPWMIRRVMDALAVRTLVPESRDGDSWLRTTAQLLLYIRSHWLRMPPALLTRHLMYKAYQRHLTPKRRDT